MAFNECTGTGIDISKILLKRNTLELCDGRRF